MKRLPETLLSKSRRTGTRLESGRYRELRLFPVFALGFLISNILLFADPDPNDPWSIDSDGDGYTDGQEIAGGYDPANPAVYPGYELTIDSDNDSYPDSVEITAGTDPANPLSFPGSTIPPSLQDTDGDTYPDEVETAAGTNHMDPTSYPGSYGGNYTDPSLLDSDGDGYTNAAELSYGSDPYNSASYPGYSPAYTTDSDGDGHFDQAETLAGTDPLDPHSYPFSPYFNDSDSDGWSDGHELAASTDPLNAASYPGAPDPTTLDSDNDGYTDYTETSAGTNPLDASSYPGYLNFLDSDGDGHTDANEIALGFNPNDATNYPGMEFVVLDSDNDGFSDYDENIAQTNPFDSTSYPGSTNTTYDADGDGYSDSAEASAGSNPYDSTSTPLTIVNSSTLDPDGDGLNNGAEQTHGTDPNLSDTDSDGLSDYAEVSGITMTLWSGIGASAFGYSVTFYTNPLNADTDVDQLADGWEVQNGFSPTDSSDGLWDLDSDGLSQGQEIRVYFTDPQKYDTDEDGESDGYEITNGTNPNDRLSATSTDSDSDFMSNSWEVQYGFNPNDAADASLDADGDGLTNLREYQTGANPTVVDSDSDGYADGFEWDWGFNPMNSADALIDSDWDTLPDLWERRYNMNPNGSGDQYSDQDGDLLQASVEYIGGYSPMSADTDGDGVSDYDEFYGITTTTDTDGDQLTDSSETGTYGTNPNNADTDGDGLSDYAEIFATSFQVTSPSGATYMVSYQTSPTLADTDGDGLNDLFEISNFFNPTYYGDGYQDDDGDGLSNRDEILTHLTNWKVADTDSDGESDGLEIAQGTDPKSASSNLGDSDGDLMRDSWETQNGLSPIDSSDGSADPDGDYVTNLEEFRKQINPFNKDSDSDGYEDGFELSHAFNPADASDASIDSDGDALPDLWEITHGFDRNNATDAGGDSDGDQLTNLNEFLVGTKPNDTDSDNDGLSDYVEFTTVYTNPSGVTPPTYTTNPLSPDSDGDLLKDGFEILNGLNPSLAADGLADRDADGLSNSAEVISHLTDWEKADTDDDGESDGEEIAQSTNPLDIQSRTSPDVDGDHMSDTWESANGLDPEVSDGALDPDQDLLNHYAEYLAKSDPFDSDTDNDGYLDGFECLHERNPLSAADALVDADGDGLPDLWEIFYNLPWQNANHPTDDPDNDGVLNLTEFARHTNPNLSDTDGDGLSDFDEIAGSGTFTGGVAWTSALDPTKSDTDGDGQSDSYEIAHGTNPTDSSSYSSGTQPPVVTTPPARTSPPRGPSQFVGTVTDSDGDGVTDAQETIDGTDQNNITSYLSPHLAGVDTDADGLLDVWEIANGLDPQDPADAWRDPDYDGLSNLREQAIGTSPFTTWATTPLEGLEPTGNQTGQDLRFPSSTIATLNDFGEMARVSLTAGQLSVSLWNSGGWGTPLPIVTASPVLAFGEVVQNNFGVLAIEAQVALGDSTATRVVVWDREGTVQIIGENLSWTSVTDLRITDSGFVAARAILSNTTEAIFRWRAGQMLTLPGSGAVKFKGLSERGEILDETRGLYRAGQWDAAAVGAFALGPYGEVRDLPDYPGVEPLPHYTRYASLSEFGEVIAGVSRLTPDELIAGYHARFLTADKEYLITVGGSYLLDETPSVIDPAIPAGGVFLRLADGLFSYTLPPDTVHHFDFDYDDDGFWDDLEALAGTSSTDDTRFPGWESNVVISDANRNGDFVGWIFTGTTRVDLTTGITLPESDAFFWQYRDFTFLGGADFVWKMNNAGQLISSTFTAKQAPDFASSGLYLPGHDFHLLTPAHDSDGDGLANDWETYYGVSDPAADPDNDTLTNGDEFIFGTSPIHTDTDADGLPDVWEIWSGTNPNRKEANLLVDLDGDTLGELAEYTHGTDPYLSDSDGDGFRDDVEIAQGLDPQDPDSNPNNVDTDQDGMSDVWETTYGLDRLDAADAGYDWDYDGLTHLEESQIGTDPRPKWRTVSIEGFVGGWSGYSTDPTLTSPVIGSFNERGQLAKVVESGGVLVLLRWDHTPISAGGGTGDAQPRPLGPVSGTAPMHVVEVRQNTFGLVAVNFRQIIGGQAVHQLRIRDNGSGPAVILGLGSGWKNISQLQVTDSGFVIAAIETVNPMPEYGNTRHLLLRWRNGVAEYRPLAPPANDTTTLYANMAPKLIGASERGEVLVRDYVISANNTLSQRFSVLRSGEAGWTPASGEPLAIGPYGLFPGQRPGGGPVAHSPSAFGYVAPSYSPSAWGSTLLPRVLLNARGDWVASGVPADHYTGRYFIGGDRSVWAADGTGHRVAPDRLVRLGENLPALGYDYMGYPVGDVNIYGGPLFDTQGRLLYDANGEPLYYNTGTTGYYWESSTAIPWSAFLSDLNRRGDTVGGIISTPSPNNPTWPGNPEPIPFEGFGDAFLLQRGKKSFTLIPTDPASNIPPAGAYPLLNGNRFWKINGAGQILASEATISVVVYEFSTGTAATISWSMLVPDNDGTNPGTRNGLPDDWETFHGITDPAGDADQDGLSNREEFTLGTNPKVVDTDGDETWDRVEIDSGTNPNEASDHPAEGMPDADGDGINDYQEIILGTNPNSTDSDGDGLTDGFEIENSLNPLLKDSDSDGFEDYWDIRIQYWGVSGEETDLSSSGKVMRWGDDNGGDFDFAQGDPALQPPLSAGEIKLTRTSFLNGSRPFEIGDVHFFAVVSVQDIPGPPGEIKEIMSIGNLRIAIKEGRITFTAGSYSTSPYYLADNENILMEVRASRNERSLRIRINGYPEIEMDDQFLYALSSQAPILGGNILSASTTFREIIAFYETLPSTVRNTLVARMISDHSLNMPTLPPAPPVYPDTDGDEMPDWWEAQYGLNIAVDDSGGDLDGDFGSNLTEFQMNTDPTGIEDVDADRMPDHWERHFALNVGVDDSEDDPDMDDRSNYDEFLDGTNPNAVGDSDQDGMPDLWESQYPGLNSAVDDASGDLDGDYFTNRQEYQRGLNPLVAEDSDNDSIHDGWEVLHGLNPANSNDAAGDLDLDSLTNLSEYQAGTHPDAIDTDGDSIPDWIEDRKGTDPLDDEDTPTADFVVGNGAGEYASISSAMLAVTLAGQIIEVSAGSYTESLDFGLLAETVLIKGAGHLDTLILGEDEMVTVHSPSNSRPQFLTGVTLTHNAGDTGSGVRVDTGAVLLITQSAITGNRVTEGSSDTGAALTVSGGIVRLENSLILRNTNTGSGEGRGILTASAGELQYVHSTATGNNPSPGQAVLSIGAGAVRIRNGILWHPGETEVGFPSVIPAETLFEIDGLIVSEVPATFPSGPHIRNLHHSDPWLTPEGMMTSGSFAIDLGESGAGLTEDIQSEPRAEAVDYGADEFVDSDGDGLPDWFENRYGLDPQDPTDAGTLAANGLSHLESYLQGLNPLVPYLNPTDDNDSDGLLNGEEATENTDPEFPDHPLLELQIVAPIPDPL